MASIGWDDVTDADDHDPKDAATQLARAHAEHAGACLLYARQVAPDHAAAQDATQEAFVRLMRHLTNTATMPDSPRAWLLTATRHAALDARRGERRRRDRERNIAPSALVAPPDASGLDADAVMEAVARLPARQREVLTLRLWADLNFAEIAAVVGVSLSTAHADHAAALRTLRRRFDPEQERP